MLKYAYHINDVFLSFEDIDISKYNEEFLINSAKRRCAATNCKSIIDYVELIEDSELERMNFYDSLQISHSSFFRNPLTFATIKEIILPEITLNNKNNSHNEIHIWSAACAEGQEAYSIAMILDNHIACKDNHCKCSIYETDKEEEQIRKAMIGQYAHNNLSNVPLHMAEKWFTRYGQTYHIKQELKDKINFSSFDLFDNNINNSPVSKVGQFQIIICANLLFYYKNKYRKMILDIMDGALSDDGFLITGETEREILLRSNYKEVYPYSAIFKHS